MLEGRIGTMFELLVLKSLRINEELKNDDQMSVFESRLDIRFLMRVRFPPNTLYISRKCFTMFIEITD
jgi:hypothetical protein